MIIRGRSSPSVVQRNNTREVNMMADHDFAMHMLAGDRAAGPDIPSAPDHVRLRELRTLFQLFLPDGSEDELIQLARIQQELHTQQVRLQSILADGILKNQEYAERSEERF